MRENQFYCVKCRGKVTLPSRDICFTTFKNRRSVDRKTPALVGTCKGCGIHVTKFVSRDDADYLKGKYGRC